MGGRSDLQLMEECVHCGAAVGLPSVPLPRRRRWAAAVARPLLSLLSLWPLLLLLRPMPSLLVLVVLLLLVCCLLRGQPLLLALRTTCTIRRWGRQASIPCTTI